MIFMCSDCPCLELTFTAMHPNEHQKDILCSKGINGILADAFIFYLFSPSDNEDLICHA